MIILLKMRYLYKADIQFFHRLLSDKIKRDGESPIPSFELADQGAIDALIDIPQRVHYDVEQYPTVESKAAIIFYTVNKGQIFGNGNKRMSTLCFGAFLHMNGKMLDVNPDELTQKALWLANTSAQKFQDIKKELESWTKEHVKDAPQP